MRDKTWLEVSHDSYTETTRERHDDDDWDRGDTHTTHSISGVSISNDSTDLWVGPEAGPGTMVHVVYAIWSTGDSFGHDSCSNIEFISAHLDRDLAEANRAKLDEAKGYGPVEVVLDDGTILPYGIPWNGYFDSLDRVDVDGFVLRPPGRR